MKSYKLSYYIFYVLIALIIVVLGLFFGVGYTNPVGEYNAPEHTETLIIFMYVILGICILVTVVGALAQFIANFKDNPKGGMRTLAGVVLFLAVVLVAYALASDAPLTMASGEVVSDASVLKMSEMMIFTIYILLIVAVIATLVNLTGIFKK